jgi:NADH-quinone oxidoreductase subunit J
MLIQILLFYMFAGVMLLSAIMVVSSRNSVHSVLFLILAFFNSAGLFILLHAEFIAMLMVIVYVGAVAVLFLFVVMMLDIKVAETKGMLKAYVPIGLLVVVCLLFEILMVSGSWQAITYPVSDGISPAVNNTESLGLLLYTKYAYLFQASGVILLVAMIGAIVLTLRSKDGVKRQKISEQVYRPVKDCIEIVKVEIGKGV